MVKSIETTGRTEEDAISAALFQLGLERDDVSVEVLERAKSGFLGFGSNPAKVRVSYEENEGVPKTHNQRIQEEVIAAARPAPAKPAAAVRPAPKKMDSRPAPVIEAPKQKETAPAAPQEMETILAAKPGWQPKNKPAPRPQPPRKSEEQRPRSAPQLQEGDEVIIGTEEPFVPVQLPPVKLIPVEAGDEQAQKIMAFLTGLVQHLDVEATPEIFINGEGGYKVILQGQNLGAIIGRRGETLDAIQQLTNYAVNQNQAKRVRIHVDAEGYRSKREESLCRLAVKVAGKVIKYRKNMTLEAMNAYERHVIHTALQEYPNISTYSTGVEPNRRTVVAYAPGQK